jgi:histidyl-tRNA synthetase
MSRRGQSFRASPGTRDVLAPESLRQRAFVDSFARTAARYGYELLQTPTFEDIGVFQRVGEGTDVVRKEMYEFTDRGDRQLALRPEGTAPVARAYAQHRPPTPWKVWYHAPMFRYERHQAARYREHTQVGAELLGSEDPDADVEVIDLAHAVLRDAGLRRVLLLINSMGGRETKRSYADHLTAFLLANRGDLADEDRERVETHPMRVLDSKREETRAVLVDAPSILDALDDDEQRRFERVQAGLRSLGISFAIEPRLVRGLDYYTHTTFEFQASALDAAQNTVCGGGRYDGLVEDMGGPPTPGIGFGMGVERTLLACDAEQAFPAPDLSMAVWVVDVTDGSHARDLTHELRCAGVAADRAFESRSMRSQMKAADRSGARLAVIIGEQEVEDGLVSVRDLRTVDGQHSVRRDDLVAEVRRLLDSAGAEG